MPKPDNAEYEKLGWLLKRLQYSEDYCRPYFDRAKRHYKLYRFGTAVEDSKWPYTNRARTRDILAFVEDTTAIILQTLFATTPFISVIPRGTFDPMWQRLGIDPIKIAKQMETCLDYQLSHEDTDFFEEMIDFIKGGGMYGNSYIGVYPKFEADGSYLIPLLKGTDFWDIIPIPGSKRVSKSRGVFVREFTTYEDLMFEQDHGRYSNVDQLERRGEGNPDIEWHKDLLQEVGMTTYVEPGDDIEVLHYFSGGHVITIANRRVILRDSTEVAQSPFPYSNPIVQYKYIPVPHEFFAMGIPEICEVLQEDKNLIRSARRDNIDLIINKIILTDTNYDINYEMLKYYPGAIWPLEKLESIKEMTMTDVSQSAYGEEALIAKDMENALSLFGYARGMTPQHAEQPTTVLKLQQASLNRQDVNVKLAEFTVLQEIARDIILLNRTYMSKQDYEGIIGEQDAGFFMLSPEQIKRFYWIRPIGSSVSHIKEVRQQQIQFALQTLTAIPPQLMQQNIEPFTVNLLELLRTALDTADVPGIDRILMPLQQNPMAQGGNMPGIEEILAMMGGMGGQPQGGGR